MKPFTKRLALVMGLLFTALICMGIVYIDTVQNYWYVNGGFVKLIVSNRTDQAIITVDTNTLRIGINTNNIVNSLIVRGQQPSNSLAGTSASASGVLRFIAGNGGAATNTTTATGGAAGGLQLFGGIGGEANQATTNATGGVGGSLGFTGGAGGMGDTAAPVATNAATGGNGGSAALAGGPPGNFASMATNAVGGNGGAVTLTGAGGGTPFGAWANKGGNGGGITANAGAGGSGIRTNGGDGGGVSVTAGLAGDSGTGGNAGKAGDITLTGGGGSATSGGGTNSNGGKVYFLGGAPSSGAVAGDVVVARNSGGTSRGGLMVGPLISGGSVSITNVLGAAASLDFPSTAAGAFNELTIAVTGVTSNNVAVALSVPWESAQTGGAFVTFNSNDVIYVRFINNQLAAAIDPTPGTFTVVGFRIR